MFYQILQYKRCVGGRRGVERVRCERVCRPPRRDEAALQLSWSAESCDRTRPLHGVVSLWRPRATVGSARRSRQRDAVPVRRSSLTPPAHSPSLPSHRTHFPLPLRREGSTRGSRDFRAEVNHIHLTIDFIPLETTLIFSCTTYE